MDLLETAEIIIELKEDTVISYLVHFLAPFTGSGEIVVHAGARFAIDGCWTAFPFTLQRRMWKSRTSSIFQAAKSNF